VFLTFYRTDRFDVSYSVSRDTRVERVRLQFARKTANGLYMSGNVQNVRPLRVRSRVKSVVRENRRDFPFSSNVTENLV